MKKREKNGFTLIELIAVLVILAIIALIVTPLIMNIVKKAKDSANKRSVDAYGKAVELGVSTYLLDNGEYPNDLNGLKIDYTGSEVVCNTQYLNKNGSVYLSKCSVSGVEVKDARTKDGYYHYGKNDFENIKSIIKSTSDDCIKDLSCTLDKIKAGITLDIMVSEDKTYKFYVISQDKKANKISLIMSRNIVVSDYVKWASYDDYDNSSYVANGGAKWQNSYWAYTSGANNYAGPITALKYLAEKTSDWTNLSMDNYIYNDEGNLRNNEIGYNGIKISSGVATVTALDGKSKTIIENLNSRMPTYDEMLKLGCTESDNSCPIWMTNSLSNYKGFWLLSSPLNQNYNANQKASSIYCYNDICSFNDWRLYINVADGNSFPGVRPVIELDLDDILAYYYSDVKEKGFDSYSIGDKITYNGMDFYVIDESGKTQSYVTVLKETPLTTAEVTKYATENVEDANIKDMNGYGAMSISSHVYASSSVDKIVDAWSNEKFIKKDLMEDDSGKGARLLTFEELIDYLGYEYKTPSVGPSTNGDTPDWLYNSDYSYWTMSNYQDNSSNYWIIEQDGLLQNTTNWNQHTIRPVINILKSAI